MTQRLAPRNRKRALFLRALQIFFAGLYAFVLPFICWGAQATPGHPHARAHFVFVEPTLSDHGADETTDIEAITHKGMDHQGANELLHRTSRPAKSQPQPAGRATPSMIGVTLLLLISEQRSLISFNMARPRFCCWVAFSIARPFVALIPTPPPR